jgi:thioredoxin
MESSDAYFERLTDSEGPILVEFWAAWCAPCRAMQPSLQRLGEKFRESLTIWQVNADEQPDLVRRLGVYGLPTLILYRDGQEVARRVGVQSYRALDALAQAAVEGGEIPPRSPAPADRIVRLIIAGTLVLIASRLEWSFWLMVLGGAFAFSAVYDRCPIWRAVNEQIKRLYKRERA